MYPVHTVIWPSRVLLWYLLLLLRQKQVPQKQLDAPNPRFPRDFADTPPVWDPIRAMNWVSVHELLANQKGRPCWRMDFCRVLSSPAAAEGC